MSPTDTCINAQPTPEETSLTMTAVLDTINQALAWLRPALPQSPAKRLLISAHRASASMRFRAQGRVEWVRGPRCVTEGPYEGADLRLNLAARRDRRAHHRLKLLPDHTEVWA